MRFRPSAAVLLVATAALAAAAWGTRQAGGSVVPGGLLVPWAFGRTACERFLFPALIASVAIDVDHIPDRLGSDWLTAGTPRPYPHSLGTIAGILIVALLWRRRRDLLVGVALGLALHFGWDLAESNAGVPLLWPFSYRSFTLPFGSYVVPMTVVLMIVAFRVRARPASESARPRS